MLGEPPACRALQGFVRMIWPTSGLRLFHIGLYVHARLFVIGERCNVIVMCVCVCVCVCVSCKSARRAVAAMLITQPLFLAHFRPKLFHIVLFLHARLSVIGERCNVIVRSVC